MTTAPGGAPPTVRIHYLRPPDRRRIYEQLLILDNGRVKITLARDLEFDPPLVLDDGVALETGSDAVWFTFPGAWHDIGRFHRADGTLTGIYANVITPCLFEAGEVWHTTDLFVDVWMPAEAGRSRPERAVLLDLDELDEAEGQGHVTPELAARAQAEGQRLLDAARRGDWPPAVVHHWTRARALATLDGTLESP